MSSTGKIEERIMSAPLEAEMIAMSRRADLLIQQLAGEGYDADTSFGILYGAVGLLALNFPDKSSGLAAVAQSNEKLIQYVWRNFSKKRTTA